jgi:hypothetical protein
MPIHPQRSNLPFQHIDRFGAMQPRSEARELAASPTETRRAIVVALPEYSYCSEVRGRGKKHARGRAASRHRPHVEAAGALPSAWRKEDLSITLLHALAAGIGVRCEHSERDINGWDVHLAGLDTAEADALQLHVQLKCTVGRLRLLTNQRELSFELKRSDYDHLRKQPTHPPRLLVVVQVPDHRSSQWVGMDAQRFQVHAKAWYLSLVGQPALPEGQKSAVVHIPLSQRLTPSALIRQMRSCP